MEIAEGNFRVQQCAVVPPLFPAPHTRPRRPGKSWPPCHVTITFSNPQPWLPPPSFNRRLLLPAESPSARRQEPVRGRGEPSYPGRAPVFTRPSPGQGSAKRDAPNHCQPAQRCRLWCGASPGGEGVGDQTRSSSAVLEARQTEGGRPVDDDCSDKPFGGKCRRAGETSLLGWGFLLLASGPRWRDMFRSDTRQVRQSGRSSPPMRHGARRHPRGEGKAPR